MVGTHTHVTTADEHVLPQGTAYITDVGMTGPHGGVIGMDRQGIIKRFLDGLPARFDVAPGDVQMNCVLIETDDSGPRNARGTPAGAVDRAAAAAQRLVVPQGRAARGQWPDRECNAEQRCNVPQ